MLTSLPSLLRPICSDRTSLSVAKAKSNSHSSRNRSPTPITPMIRAALHFAMTLIKWRAFVPSQLGCSSKTRRNSILSLSHAVVRLRHAQTCEGGRDCLVRVFLSGIRRAP